MRKRSIAFLCDNVMWYLIYLFPLLVVLISLIHNTPSDVFSWVFSSSFGQFANTQIYITLSDVFGADGILPLFTGDFNNFVLLYFTYFVSVMILHLCVDFLLFIPRWAHAQFDKLCGGSEK